MANFMIALISAVADLSLRHLLLANGAAAMTVVLYYYVNRGDRKKTADAEDKTVLEEPLCEQDTEPALVQSTEVQDQMTEAEEKFQKLVVSNHQQEDSARELEDSARELEDSVRELEDSVRELEELLYDARRDCEKKNVAMGENEEKHLKAMEEEISDLRNQVETLRDQINDIEDLLSKGQEHLAEIMNEREREAQRILQVKNNDAMPNSDAIASVADTKEEHQKAVEYIIQLEEEKSDLRNHMETMRDRIADLKSRLCKTHRQDDALMNVTEEKEFQ